MTAELKELRKWKSNENQMKMKNTDISMTCKLFYALVSLMQLAFMMQQERRVVVKSSVALVALQQRLLAVLLKIKDIRKILKKNQSITYCMRVYTELLSEKHRTCRAFGTKKIFFKSK